MMAERGLDWNDEQKKRLQAITPTKGLETWNDVVEDYIEKYQKAKKGNRQHGEVKRILLSPGWSQKTFREITDADIHDALDAHMAAGHPYAANNLHKCLGGFYKWCWSRRRKLKLNENPMEGIERPFDQTKPRVRHWTNDEIKALWEAADTLGGPPGGLMKMLILTGQRLNEVAGLRWSELDLEAGTWTLPAERSKNKREHTFPLSGLAKRVIQAQPEMDGSDLVFPGRLVTKPMSGWSKLKQKIQKESKVQDFTYHDARHTLATRLSGLKVDGRHIAPPHIKTACLNHTPQGVTEGYSHYDYLDEQREAFEAWAQAVTDIVWPDGVVRLHG